MAKKEDAVLIKMWQVEKLTGKKDQVKNPKAKTTVKTTKKK